MAAKKKQLRTEEIPAKAQKPVVSVTEKGTSFFTDTPFSWRKYGLPMLLLLVLSFGLYAASLSFGYVLDDTLVIVENSYVNPTDSVNTPGLGERLGKIFAKDSFMGYFKEEKKLLEGGRYRPLSIAMFAVEREILGGLNPKVGHFINILLYALTGWLLFWVLLGLFPIKDGENVWFSVAFLGSVLFLLNPLHTEVVANVKGRDEILALLGSLAALWAAMKYSDTSKSLWLLLSGFLFFVGLLAKENVLTFLAVIPLTLWLFGRASAGKIAITTAVLAFGALAFIALRTKALGYFVNPGNEITDVMNNPFYGMVGGEKTATIFLTLGWYLKLLVWPHPLTHDYYPYHVPKVNWSDWRALLSLVVYLGLGVFAVLNLRRRKVLAWSILFFIATLSIVSNLFVSVGTFMNERFLYMPSVAFAVLTAWLLADRIPTWIKERPQAFNYISAAILAVFAVGYAIRTVTRVPDWKDRLTLNTTAYKNSPNSARANCFMATALYEDIFKKSTDEAERKKILEEMAVMLDKSLDIYPMYGSALTMRAGVAGEIFQQDNQLDKLFHEFGWLLERHPNMKFIHEYMEYLLPRANNSKYSAFCHRMGYEYFFQKKKDFPNAIRMLDYGIRANYNIQGSKGDARLLNDMAEVYRAQGNATKAAEFEAKAADARQ